MEVLQEVPNSSAFVPLSEHQSATPASFYSGPPVLHYHSGRCKVVILERDLSLSPALTILARETEKTSTTTEPVTNGNGEQGEEDDEPIKQKVVGDVDVWVTSECATFLV
jgi:nucleotide-sensitive chloride channel 1A